jgi:molybdopterin molybdotransferase
LISTGAPVPIGATRVVRREDATRRGTLVEVPALSGTKRDIRARGSDYRAGTPLVGTGRRLDPIDIARLCGAGVGVVQVAPQPRVAIVPTGDEIAHDGEAIGSDQIYDALSLPLSMRAETAGAVTRMRPPVRDGDDLIEAAIAGLDTDIIVFIGGASRGPHDRVRPALESLGLDLVVPALLVRPGKPSWCGQLADGRIVIGLAGNPVAALACAELLLLPLLRTWQGRSPHGRSFALPSEAASGGPLSRLQFGRLDISADGRAVAVPTGGSDSAALHPITGAELLIIRDPDGSGRAILLDP